MGMASRASRWRAIRLSRARLAANQSSDVEVVALYKLPRNKVKLPHNTRLIIFGRGKFSMGLISAFFHFKSMFANPEVAWALM